MNFPNRPLDMVIIGRSILTSYGNSTAVLYRGLINELAKQGHRTIFLEPFDPVAATHRDMLRSPYCEVWTYKSTEALLKNYRAAIASADVVMLGNGVADADKIAEWIATEAAGVTIYYDTDLARTRANVNAARRAGDCLSCRTIGLFNLYLSTTGGPALEQLARENELPRARPLYESIDPFTYYRTDTDKTYDLGLINHYRPAHATALYDLLINPAHRTPNRQFVLAGDHYPEDFTWPRNLTYLEHLPATNHVDFYNRQHANLVLSRPDRRELGYTPSRRLLAAAACGVPILTDPWDGLDEFFEPNRDLYTVTSEHDVLDVLYGTDEAHRRRIGNNARERVLAEHTTDRRAKQLMGYWREVMD